MLPELVTRNVTNDSIGGIVFGSRNRPKDHDPREGEGVLNLGVEIIRKLMVQERTQLWKNIEGYCF